MPSPDDFETAAAALVANLSTLQGYGSADVVATSGNSHRVRIYPAGSAGIVDAVAPASQLAIDLGLTRAGDAFGASTIVILQDTYFRYAFARFRRQAEPSGEAAAIAWEGNGTAGLVQPPW